MMTEFSIVSELSYQLEFPSHMVILFHAPPPPSLIHVLWKRIKKNIYILTNNVSMATVDFF